MWVKDCFCIGGNEPGLEGGWVNVDGGDVGLSAFGGVLAGSVRGHVHMDGVVVDCLGCVGVVGAGFCGSMLRKEEGELVGVGVGHGGEGCC